MAVLKSNRIVHLDYSGNLISEEWPDPSYTVEMDQASEAWQLMVSQSPKFKGDKLPKSLSDVPITSIVRTSQPDEKPFGWDNRHRKTGKRYKLFGIKN